MDKDKATYFPKMDFMNFFNGKVEAKGHLIQYYPKKVIKNLVISFEGKVVNKKLILIENYKENDNALLREWSFDKVSNNSFIGQEKNVVGKIRLNSKDNYLTMKYLFKILFWKMNVIVNVVDEMYMLNSNELINSTLVSKYKLKLATCYLLYKKL